MADLTEQIEALERHPSSIEAAEAVRAIARNTGAYDRYAAAFLTRGAALADRDEVESAIETYLEAALVFEEEVGDVSSAAVAYEAVLELQAGHRRALFALGLVLHDLGRWEDLIALYRRRMETSTDSGERTTLHLYVAEILAERLDDDKAAFTEILRAVRLTPTNIRIVTRLEELGDRTGRYDEVAVAIGDLIINQVDPRIRAALSLRLAELNLGPLNDSKRALAYLKAALADDGGNPEILSEIEDVFRERARFDELAEVLEESAKDRRVGPHRVRLERELARIYELELDDLPRALAAVTRAARLTPDDRELLDEVMRLGLVSGDLLTVADTYEDVCEATDNALLGTYMRLKLGHIYANVLARTDDAIRVYGTILETEPQHSEARRRLMRLHERHGHTEQLVRLLEVEAGETDQTSEAIETLERVVQLCDEELHDTERANEACRRIAQLDPSHVLAKRSAASVSFDLDSVGVSAVATDATEVPTEFDGGGYGPEAETHFAPEVAPLRVPRRVPTTDDLVLDDAPPVVLDDVEAAVAAASQDLPPSEGVRLLTPDEDEVQVEDEATEFVVEPAVAPRPPRRPPPPPPRGDSAAVEPSAPISAKRPPPPPPRGASAAEPPPAMLEPEPYQTPPPKSRPAPTMPPPAVAEPEPYQTPPPKSRPAPTMPPPPPSDVINLDQFAGAELDDWDSPDDSLVSVVAVSDEDAHIEQEPTEAFLAAEPPTAEARIATQEIRQRPRPTLEVVEEGTNEVDASSISVSISDTIQDRAPSDDAVDEGREAEVNEVAARLAEIQKELVLATEQNDQPKMVELLEELVRTNERLEQNERAFFSMVRLAQIDPTPERIDQTIRLGRRAQGYPLLIDTVERLVDKMTVEQQVKIHLKLGEIESDDLDDLTRALARFELLAKIAPRDEAVLGRHLSLLDAAGRHEEVARVLVARADAHEEPAERRPFVLRAVAVYEAKLDAPHQAATLLIDHLELAPDDDEIFNQAINLLERTNRFDQMIAVYDRQAARVEGEELSQIRLEIAKIHRERLDDIDAAEAVLRRGLEERARDPGLLEALESTLADLGKWGEFVDVGLRRLEVLHSVATKNALRKRIARVSEEQLASPDLALDLLGSALADDPTDLEALLEIERLRRLRDDWDGVLAAVMMRADIDEDPEGQVSALLEGARISADVFGDLDGAEAALSRALAIAPGHDRTLEALATAATMRGDDNAAVEVLRRLADGATGKRLAELHVRIGVMFEDRIHDREAARAEYEAAYEADIGCRDAVVALLDFSEAEGDFIRAHELAAEAAKLSADERDGAALWCRAGQLAQERVGDDLKALEYYERALAIDSDDLATEATVGDLLLARGELERAYPHLDKAARGLSDPDRSSRLHFGAARAADELGRHDDARASFEAALAYEPTSAEALDRLGALLVEDEDWERVYELGASLILHHESSLAPAQRGAVYLRMALAKRGLDDFEAAARLAKKSHQLAEREVGPLRLYAEMLEHAGDTFEAAECLKRLSGLLEREGEKRDALVHAANLLGEHDGDLARASAMLTEAQTYAPADIELAEQLCRYRTMLQDPSGAADAVVCAARERDGRQRADLLVRAARVLIAGARERPRARELLGEALELEPTHAGARADLSVILEFDGDVDELARVEVRAADRFIEDESTEDDAVEGDRTATAVALYLRATEILRHRLELPEQALALCRKLMTLAPSTPGVRETYARLLDALSSRGGPTSVTMAREAIGAWAYLLEQRPGYVEALERLAVLRHRVGDELQARVTTEVLQALGEPIPADAHSNGQAKPNSLDTRVINTLTAVEIPVHPAEDSTLKELFYALGYAPLRAFGDMIPEPRPKKRDVAGAAGLGIHVSRPIGYTARVLGKDSPPVYIREDAPAAVVASFVNDEAAIIVSLGKAEQHSVEELRFLFGRCFSLLRPRALALEILPLEVLREGLIGYAKLPDPESHHVDPKAAKRRGRALERAIPPGDRERVSNLALKWLAAKDRRTLGDEREAVMRTAERFGLVVSGSVATSIQVLSSLSGGHIERGWHAPLLSYATTRQYAEMLRRLQ